MLRNGFDGLPLLAQVVRDQSQPVEVRAEAIVGISAARDKYRDVIRIEFTKLNEPVLRREATRAVRLYRASDRRERGEAANTDNTAGEAKPRADDIKAWQELLKEPGDAASGRRLFFSPVGPQCSNCHKYAGRGGNIGPDLTNLANSTTRERIITSILQPSQEIAPDYQPWILVTTDGKTLTGLRQPKPGDDGTEDYVDSAGALFTLASKDIEERHAATTSIMPDNLQSALSTDDLRDLVTFLTTTAE
jgi:hypothetical protein